MRTLKLALLIVVILAGCTTPPPFYEVRTRYHGLPVEVFFSEWGSPIASHKIKHHRTMYLWYSGRDSRYYPGHTDTRLIGNTAWWRGYRLHWWLPPLECGVRIITGPDHLIQEILLHESSAGWWEVQRCRDVFGPPLPP
jgi:hypothetical protein